MASRGKNGLWATDHAPFTIDLTSVG